MSSRAVIPTKDLCIYWRWQRQTPTNVNSCFFAWTARKVRAIQTSLTWGEEYAGTSLRSALRVLERTAVGPRCKLIARLSEHTRLSEERVFPNLTLVALRSTLLRTVIS